MKEKKETLSELTEEEEGRGVPLPLQKKEGGKKPHLFCCFRVSKEEQPSRE